jgi:hypothetical protein
MALDDRPRSDFAREARSESIAHGSVDRGAGLPDLESIIDEQWLAWYLLTPMERWNAAQEMWREYLAMGGSLEPEVDSQSPFFDLDDTINAPPPDSRGRGETA